MLQASSRYLLQCTGCHRCAQHLRCYCRDPAAPQSLVDAAVSTHALAQGQIRRGERRKSAALRPCDMLSAARADRAIVRFKLQPRSTAVAILEDLAAVGWPQRLRPAKRRCRGFECWCAVLSGRSQTCGQSEDVPISVLRRMTCRSCGGLRAQDARGGLLAFRGSGIAQWEQAVVAEGFADPDAEVQKLATNFLVCHLRC